MFFGLSFVFLSCLGLTLGSVPTCSQITTMTTAINKALIGSGTTNLQAPALRLGFHDCVGGCNGCINFNNSDNAGLADVVTALTSSFNTNGFASIVSLADYFALATTVSANKAVQASNTQRSGNALLGPCPVPCFTLQWGRKTLADCSNDGVTLPSPTMTGDAMFTYFANQFGFSRSQVVALMGAHSFGGAFTQNSGYSGKWTGTQSQGLNEVFYTTMLNSNITFTNVNVATRTAAPKWQFRGKLANGTEGGFMLNTDFELMYNLTLDSNAKTTCTLNPTCGLTNSCSGNCPMATTFSQAQGYSKNCTSFMADFTSVLQLMLANGYSSSALASSSCTC